MRNITISQIAKLAGVSKTTVSRVINNRPDVHAETREKVQGIIRENGFYPNAYAKAISEQRSYTIGLVIPYGEDYIFLNPYYSEIMRGVSTEAKKYGYHMLITYSKGDDYVSVIRQKRVDGIILISPGSDHKKVIQELKQLDVPFVATSKMPGVPDINYICIDDF